MVEEYTRVQSETFSNGYDYWCVFISDKSTTAKFFACYKVNGGVIDTQDTKPKGFPLEDWFQGQRMMFSASRSRRLQIVPIIQSFSQLDKNYGKEGSEIIVDNTQITLFGGFAPNSSSAETLSKALGSRTVMTGSVSRSKNDPSQSLQMIERPLLTPDELKSLPKGDFVVMKTGVHPMRVHLKLFFKWGIEFDEKHPYSVAEHGNRKVEYAEKKEIQDGIMKKYHPQEYAELQEADKASASGGQDQAEAQRHEPQKTPPQGDSSKDKSKSGGGLKPERRDRSIREAVSEVKSDGQA